MVGSSKILTVSYGTFSCTLEGFDNPFGTMQSIAEYFRDLAAEDRYFGAEPPQPDAQMLHQIAEREVRRRVEARVGDSGVVLRQMAEEAATDESAPETQNAAPDPQTPPAQDAAVAPEAEASQSETVAERLARIRQVVAKARAERTRTYEEDEPVEDTDDDSLLSAFAAAEDAEPAEEDSPDYALETEVNDDSEPADTASHLAWSDGGGETDGGDADPQDIHSSQPVDTPPGPEAAHQVGDATTATVAAGLSLDPAQRAADVPAIGHLSSDAHEPAAEPEVPVAEVVDDNGKSDGYAAPKQSAGDPEPASPGEGASDATPSLNAPSTAKAEENVGDDIDSIQAALAEAESPVPPERHDSYDTTTDAETDDFVEIEMEDETGAPKIVKMTRAEFEAALANGDIEEVEDEEETAVTVGSDATDSTEDTIRGLLSDTQLDDAQASELAAELAQIEGDETAPGKPETEQPQTVEPVTEADEEARPEDAQPESLEAETASDNAEAAESGNENEPAPYTGKAESAEAAPSDPGDRTVTRLIDETNSQMGEPEGNRRRSAIQHLRRAVMATRADSRLRNRKDKADASIAPYRDDLEQAVKPRRPQSGSERHERPQNVLDHPLNGPLVLVSSQRVDLQREPVKPVRPVRPAIKAVEAEAAASKPSPAPAEDSASFEEFARKLGAHDLPDLLEAAAAYSQIVEGQEGVSRPALIRRAATASGGQISREDGLKSFGQLLRTGRIRKVHPGRFALAEGAEMAEKARAVH